MHHPARRSKTNILFMHDTGYKLNRISLLENDIAKIEHDAYFIRWISIIDLPIFTVVYRGTNLAAKYMVDQLQNHQSQVLPIPTEAPWSLGKNDATDFFSTYLTK